MRSKIRVEAQPLKVSGARTTLHFATKEGMERAARAESNTSSPPPRRGCPAATRPGQAAIGTCTYFEATQSSALILLPSSRLHALETGCTIGCSCGDLHKALYAPVCARGSTNAWVRARRDEPQPSCETSRSSVPLRASLLLAVGGWEASGEPDQLRHHRLSDFGASLGDTADERRHRCARSHSQALRRAQAFLGRCSSTLRACFSSMLALDPRCSSGEDVVQPLCSMQFPRPQIIRDLRRVLRVLRASTLDCPARCHHRVTFQLKLKHSFE